MGSLVAVLDKKNRNAAKIAVRMLKTLNSANVQAYGISSSATLSIEKTIATLEDHDLDSATAIGYASRKILTQDEPQPLKLEKGALVFDGRLYPSTGPCDARAFAKKIRSRIQKEVTASVRNVDGDFAFVIAESDNLIAGRDSIGAHPLYYGQNASHAVLASEPEALKSVGVDPCSFPSGQIAFVKSHGFRFKSVINFAPPKPRRMTMQAAASELSKLLSKSVEARVYGAKNVAIAFSGGLDSSLIADFAKTAGANVNLVHVSLENQPETEHAKIAAEELKLPILACLYAEKEIQSILPNILRLVGEPDVLKVSIGIPIYLAARQGVRNNLNIMLAGQGADELFGGYRRYVDCYVQHGCRRTQDMMFEDVLNLYKNNFERDFGICRFHGVELRLPFAASKIVRFAIALPLRLKMEPSVQTLRKLVLRQIAKNIGLSQIVAERPKKAIQYATGTAKVLKKIASKEDLTIRQYLQKVLRKTSNDDCQ